jgi:hypothetical protein
MKDMFSSTGVTAGILNWRQVLSTPPASATKDMQAIYGNMRRVIRMALRRLSGSCPARRQRP